METQSSRKHRAMLDAAEQLFLRDGYLATNMDELAALSRVSKQTIYTHFGSKEALFVELVSSMTTVAGDAVHWEAMEPTRADELAPFLEEYAERQLATVLAPRLLSLRRLVIGEVGRFPDLAQALFDNGPRRAMGNFADLFGRLAARGLLTITNAETAASSFNWLVMGAPLNEAMLLGDTAAPSPDEQRAHVAEAVRIFLASHRS